MSPIIQATLALTWSTLVGMVSGYYLRKLTHDCPAPPPLVRIGSGGRAHLHLSGSCQLGQRFADVSGTGSMTVEISGDGVTLAPGEHDLSGIEFKS